MSTAWKTPDTDLLVLIPTRKEADALVPSARFLADGPLETAVAGGVRIVLSGIGKANASFAAVLAARLYAPQSILLTGICGAYRGAGAEVGDVVCVSHDVFADEALYLGDRLTLVSEMGFPVCPDNRVPFEPVSGLKAVGANTVSLLSGTDELARLYQEKTGAAVETMEGAAAGLAALKLGIPSAQVRSVSNYCGRRENQQWDIRRAVHTLKSWLEANIFR